MGNIPLVDLKAQHQQVTEEVKQGFERVFANTSFVLGKEVAEFEQAFAHFIGTKHAVGVANGTDALELALRALAIGSGDEVIVPVNSFIASALAIARTGATPVFVDCDAKYQLIDPAQVAKAVTKKTRAIMPVHLFGQCAPMDAIQRIADECQALVIEDAAQAQGAKQNGRNAGTFGAVAGTSFYPGKNLGAYGDGGAVMTSSDDIAKKVRALRNYGSEVKYHHPETGFNSRLDTLQAVVVSAKPKRLDGWNAARRSAATRYRELLAGVRGIELPEILPGNETIWHLYVVRVQNGRRDEILNKMQADGVGVGIHYPVPIHLQGAFKSAGKREGDFPVAERAAKEILSLPMFAEITPEQQTQVAASLKKAIG